MAKILANMSTDTNTSPIAQEISPSYYKKSDYLTRQMQFPGVRSHIFLSGGDGPTGPSVVRYVVAVALLKITVRLCRTTYVPEDIFLYHYFEEGSDSLHL